MGNFGSKEDILSEIEGLFKKMNSGKLTLEELEDLVSLSRELHERTVILRYKAFEEKVFGVRPVAVEVPQAVVSPEEVEVHEEVEQPAPVIEMVEEEIIEEEEIADEAPAFEIQVDTKDEPSFGFSLFGDLDEEEDVTEPSQPVTEQPLYTSVSHEEPTMESSLEIEQEIEEDFNDEIVEDTPIAEHTEDRLSEEELAHQLGENQTVNEANDLLNESRYGHQNETEPKPMSEVERAHAENLARFFNRSQTAQETPAYGQPVITEEEPLAAETEITSEIHHEQAPEEIEEEIIPAASNFYHEETHIEEPQTASEFYDNEEVEEENQTQHVAANDGLASSIFVHKYNQVSSELAGSQFGLVKLDSLLGSFGLNERLQFINELFDGSSEGFSNAIKHLDKQPSFEQARSKVAEYAVENNWDVESETVVEFMQKIIRRYA